MSLPTTDVDLDVVDLLRGYDEGLYTWLEVLAKTVEVLERGPLPESIARGLPLALRQDVREYLSRVDPATCVMFGRSDEILARRALATLIRRLRDDGFLDAE